MGTTADKLSKLLATKAGIKSAIIEKGQPVTDADPFASYEDKIRAIRTSDIQLANITVTKQPTKTSYTAKESFNPAGMEVKAVFSNDAYKFVDNFTVEPSGALKPTDTKATVKYTEFGVTAEADVAITVAAIKLAVPSVSGSLTYTGSALNPTWSGYDSDLMSISGDTSGVNAGSYSAVFSLKDKVNYTWADGTTADKSVSWSIGKAQASITLDKSSVVLNGDKLTETVIINSVGMSSIMVMSSDMSVATVSLDGNVLTISSVNETTGEATIVINGEVDSNYNAPEYPSIAVSAEFSKFRAIMDLGTTEVVAYGSIPTQWSGTLPSGYNTCTHALINGEIYSLGIQLNATNNFVYNVPDFDGIGGINISIQSKVVVLMGAQPGTYTVQLGQMVSGSVKLSSIAVTTPPTKATYSEGEVCDPEGMVVTATYSDGFTMPVTNYTIIGGDTISEANPTVTISYTEGGVTVNTAYEVGFAKPMISFTIHEYRSGDRTYQAEEGMTWGEWVDSEYNPERSAGIKLYEVGFDDLIQNNEHSLSVMNSNDWTFPRSTDLIIANGAYELAKD